MQEGSVIKNYKILRVLRPGAGGNVYVAEDLNTHEIVVVKSSFVDAAKRGDFESVNLAWKSLSDLSEFVVKFKEFFYEGAQAFTVMEYCAGGDLESLIKKKKSENTKFTEFEVATFLHDICSGLNVLHMIEKLLHRDIKPGNILVTADGRGKLADFNIAHFLADDGKQSMTVAGSLPYMAAEILQNNSYSFSSDMFAVGTVLYELLTLTPCFSSIAEILANRYTPIDPALGYSAGLCELVKSLLSENPAHRPTAAAVLANKSLTLALLVGEVKTLKGANCGLSKIQADQDALLTTLRTEVAELQQANQGLKKQCEASNEDVARLTRVIELQAKVIDLSRTVFSIDEFSLLRGRTSGNYLIQLIPSTASPPQPMYFDLSDPKHVWMRLCMKVGKEVQSQQKTGSWFGSPWTVEMVKALRPHVKDFGISDQMLTIHTGESWVIKDVVLSAGKTVSYLQFDENVDIDLYLSNVLNGMTPTGTQWTLGYDAAYVHFTGLFQTFGSWSSMYVGAGWTSYSNVGEQLSLRSGGHLYHTGEFIHSTCNGYGSKDHSVTARVDWENTRVLWFRLE